MNTIANPDHRRSQRSDIVRRLGIASLFLLGTPVVEVQAQQQQLPLRQNLLENPGAEASAGAGNYTTAVALPGWTVVGSFTPVQYQIGGANDLNSADSSEIGGGANYFAGGPGDDSQATQIIDVSSRGAQIDAGQVVARASGYFGGFAGQSDSMKMDVTFLGDNNQALGVLTIGRVSPSDRGGVSRLLPASRRSKVPPGTRRIEVKLLADRVEGDFNDGYADNLNLELSDAFGSWAAGRDLVSNEKPDAPQEAFATNSTVSEWSYGTRATVSSRALTLATPAQHQQGRSDFRDMDGWNIVGGIFVNTGASPVVHNFGFGPLKPMPPGMMYLHPGQDLSPAVVRWTAPTAGSYTIAASWIDLDPYGGDGASAHVVINGGAPAFEQAWNNNGSAEMTPQTFTLNEGDVVDFCVGARGDFTFDATGFNATITAAGLQAGSFLSNTGFTVNDRFLPTANAADVILRFASAQSSSPAGIFVRVQATTTPTVESSWTDLPDGNAGRMVSDIVSNLWVLNSTSYPRENGIFFRSITAASGFRDNISNVVGPFDLASGLNHVGPTHLQINDQEVPTSVSAGNPLFFSATQPTAGAGVHIQFSATPHEEGSWADLEGGELKAQGPQELFTGASDRYPTGATLYFRAVSTAPDAVGSLSNIIGPFNLTRNNLPVVNSMEVSGNSRRSPIPVAVAASDSDGTVAAVELYVDGIFHSRDTTAPFNFDLRGVEVGDHRITAKAIDNLGGEGLAHVEHLVIIDGTTNYTRVASGAWSDPAGWSPTAPPGGPGANDTATIVNHSVTLNGAVTVRSLRLDADLSGPGPLTVTDNLSWTGGTVSSITLNIRSTANYAISSGRAKKFSNVTINNAGRCHVVGVGADSDTFSELINTGEFTISGDQLEALLGTVNSQARPGAVTAPEFWNPFGFLFPPKPPVKKIGKVKNNGGIVKVKGRLATSSFTQTAGTLTLGGRVIARDGAGIISRDGAGIISRDGAGLVGNDGGSLVGLDSGSFQPRTNSGAASTESVVTANAAPAAVTLQGGTLTGSGRISGTVVNEGGFISPGDSPGVIEILGDYSQSSGGTLILELAGTERQTDFDQLAITGGASLGGNLILRALDGYVADGNPVAPLTYGSVSGAFNNVSANGQITLGEDGMRTVLAGANPPAPKALNISTRMRVEAGDNALIAGFIITGDAPKKVLVRGIGPSLPVSGALADPVLSLDNGAITNDDWKSNQEQDIRDTTIPPSSDLESAIVATLSPGPHTAILRGKSDGTGVGLVEVYDLESATPVQLANISTRGQVQAGDNVMIGGFIIGGDYPARVLLRAIGPSLPVNGKLEDPTLELVDANGGRITNDDWRATQEAEIIATTVPPTNDKEAAIVATLVPGFYTAIVRGKDDTVGIALVEGYNLQ